VDESDDTLLARLSLEEKVSLLSGKDHWSLPALTAIGLDAIVMSDGPTGVKGSGDGSVRSPTAPCGTALAATWNLELVEGVAALLGETARAHGIHVLLAPATNILRSPLGGRNFEYFSEDPLLAAKMTCAYVRGVQSQGVAATVKHFVCNDAETHRKTGTVEIDEQTLREVYLLPFEMAVRDEGVWAVMSAYNRLRGTYMSAQPLLDELLRQEWGFTGIVVSDWGAVTDTVRSARSGLDVEMPGPGAFRGEKLVAAVRAGEVEERVIDEKVLRLLLLARRTGALAPSPTDRRSTRAQSDAAALLRRAAAESFVLVKNEGGLLPFAADSSVAFLGDVAALPPLQGGGSSNVGLLAAPSPFESFRALAGPSADIRHEPELPQAIDAARAADVAVVFAGLGEEHESEGFDRTSLDLPREQLELITAVAAANPRTVVVLSVGAPVSLDWAKHVPAILLAWYGGQELGPALAAVLTGGAEPGGRLPMTWPADAGEVPVLDPGPDDRDADVWHYREGLFVGYRHFDKHELEPAYCFGHGLGYTRFGYEGISVERTRDGEFHVSVRIRNRGARRGKEVVQLYVGSADPSRPPLELKAFSCVELDPGAEREIAFSLAERAFSHWDSEAGRFAPIAGAHEIAVGSSSRILPLRTTVTLSPEPVAS
jgi:beta-glucosidase